MSEAITFIILFSIYAVSAAGIWLHLHFAFSKGGIMEDEKPDLGHLVVVFFPSLNTISFLIVLFFWGAFRRNGEPRITLNRFFGINKWSSCDH
jgi:hypothetical protein